jgi:hypothetical protein
MKVTIENTTIENSTALLGSGGIMSILEAKTVEIYYSTLFKASAGLEGKVIYSVSSSITELYI